MQNSKTNRNTYDAVTGMIAIANVTADIVKYLLYHENCLYGCLEKQRRL